MSKQATVEKNSGISFTVGLNHSSQIVNNIKINFQCKFNPNSEEVILFLHGLACSIDTFRNVFDENYFPDKSLLLIDLPGFGKSAKPEDFSYSMEEQAKIISELLQKLTFKKIHIVAHSMGGTIALLLPDMILSDVISFTNVEGNLIPEDCGILSRGVSSISYEDYKNNLYKKHLEEFSRHHQLRFEESTPYAIHKSACSLVEWSDSGRLLEKFRDLDCRKSYFYGEENNEMPILAKLDFVEKYMIHNADHGMTTENPKEFYDKLVEFIGKGTANKTLVY